MADPRLFRLRVTFRETGRLAMLSHLELARALERAVRRAGLPYAVSQGFSPHMRIAFVAALPVGVGGTSEFFDLFLTDYVPPAKALAALQAASPADLMPTEACYVEPKAAAASVACPVSTYEVQLSAAPAALIVPETITVVRKKKEKALSDFWKSNLGIGRSPLNALKENKETVYLSYQLARMKDDIPIAQSLEDFRLNIDKAALKEELSHYEMLSLIAELRL